MEDKLMLLYVLWDDDGVSHLHKHSRRMSPDMVGYPMPWILACRAPRELRLRIACSVKTVWRGDAPVSDRRAITCVGCLAAPEDYEP